MAEVTIRKAVEADLGALREMIFALARHHGDVATVTPQELHRDTMGDTPWVTILVAQLSDRLVGYAALCPLSQMQFGVRGTDLHHLFVYPDQRGTGIGRMLIEASIAQARALGCRFLAVGTHPDNTEAQALYRALGFEEVSSVGPRFRMKFAAQDQAASP